jgi:hypothetical protein
VKSFRGEPAAGKTHTSAAETPVVPHDRMMEQVPSERNDVGCPAPIEPDAAYVGAQHKRMAKNPHNKKQYLIALSVI